MLPVVINGHFGMWGLWRMIQGIFLFDSLYFAICLDVRYLPKIQQCIAAIDVRRREYSQQNF